MCISNIVHLSVPNILLNQYVNLLSISIFNILGLRNVVAKGAGGGVGPDGERRQGEREGRGERGG